MGFAKILRQDGGWVLLRFGLCSPAPGDGSSAQEADPAMCENGK